MLVYPRIITYAPFSPFPWGSYKRCWQSFTICASDSTAARSWPGEISGGDVLLQNGWFSTIATLNKARKVTYHYFSGFQMALFSLSFLGFLEVWLQHSGACTLQQPLIYTYIYMYIFIYQFIESSVTRFLSSMFHQTLRGLLLNW
jgi:hypothetical protein